MDVGSLSNLEKSFLRKEEIVYKSCFGVLEVYNGVSNVCRKEIELSGTQQSSSGSIMRRGRGEG